MDNIKDLLLKYSGKEILVILDNDNKVWFNATNICVILKYSAPRNIIHKLVDKEFIKQFKNIVYDYKLFPNAQPNSLSVILIQSYFLLKILIFYLVYIHSLFDIYL